MRTSMFLGGVASLFIVVIAIVPDIHGRTSSGRILKQAELSLRAICERGEFRPKRFRGKWLDDSSGYTASESVPGQEKRILVRYDVASGK